MSSRTSWQAGVVTEGNPFRSDLLWWWGLPRRCAPRNDIIFPLFTILSYFIYISFISYSNSLIIITSKKNSGSREPLDFKDPLFYLSSFQLSFCKKPAANRSGLFLYGITKSMQGGGMPALHFVSKQITTDTFVWTISRLFCIILALS
jgi:hypothetical protein